MKKLLTIALLTVSAVSYSACNIELDVKKEGAKTAYAGGTSVSQKIQDALSTQCKITKNVLSQSEVKKMALENAKKRYEKLLEQSGEKK